MIISVDFWPSIGRFLVLWVERLLQLSVGICADILRDFFSKKINSRVASVQVENLLRL